MRRINFEKEPQVLRSNIVIRREPRVLTKYSAGMGVFDFCTYVFSRNEYMWLNKQYRKIVTRQDLPELLRKTFGRDKEVYADSPRLIARYNRGEFTNGDLTFYAMWYDWRVRNRILIRSVPRNIIPKLFGPNSTQLVKSGRAITQWVVVF